MDDGLNWKCDWTVEKYRDGSDTPYEVVEEHGNLLMYGGASALWQRLIGTGVTAFSNAVTHLGVGDSTTAAVATQTDLQASSNKFRKVMEATYPVHTDGTALANASIIFRSSFSTAQANFAWNEWAIFNDPTAGRMLNRKVSSLGTKTSADTWVLTVTLTVS